MKSLGWIAAAAALSTIAAVAPAAHAQGTQTMSETDRYRARWAFYNLDAREVTRYKTMGYTDERIKMLANISLTSGVSLDHLVRLNNISGYNAQALAAMFNVPTHKLDDDIPGYGERTAAWLWDGSSSSGSTGTSSGTASGTSSSSINPGVSSSTQASNARGSVVQVAMANSDFSTLVTALQAADLVNTLEGSGPYTVLAPTNAAFAKLPQGTLEELLKPENKERLRTLLLYHVVPGRVKSADVTAMSNPQTPQTLVGKTLSVKTTAPVMINDAQVTSTDIEAANGVIHVIDSVLMPPAD
jgi:Secreted and surface protein containing fasciclin-like repeats